jgi:prepilin-type processing-associated H-X9-DG protein
MPRGSRAKPEAFTRIELVVVLATLALLAGVVLPVLASTRPRGATAACANNLGRIGRAFTMWATEHGDHYPWQVSSADGGNLDMSQRSAAWFQFASVSTELATPKILFCPSDAKVKATVFTRPPFGDGSVSYLLSHPFPQDGRTILSADRNINQTFTTVFCASFLSARSFPVPAPNPTWNVLMHGNRGQLLFNDGSVEQTDNSGLRAALSSPNLDNAAFHYLSPDF